MAMAMLTEAALRRTTAVARVAVVVTVAIVVVLVVTVTRQLPKGRHQWLAYYCVM
jgi:hypothetical protein